MKNIILLAVLLPFKLFSQTDTLPKNADGKYEYTAVVNVDSASADKLYSNAKMFVALSFKSGKDVTQLNDDAGKTVIGSGNTPTTLNVGFGTSVASAVKFTFIIQCKDNRYKYSISEFQYYNTGDRSSTKALEDKSYFDKNKTGRRFFRSLSEQISVSMKSLLTQLTTFMSSENKKTKDW